MRGQPNVSSQDVSVLDTPLVDNQTTFIFIYVLSATICQAVASCGIGTNVVNIVCFVKQGFSESINISLLGLSMADLCCLISIIFYNISVMPVLNMADLPFDVMGVYYLAVGMPHLTFSRVSTWMTAIITLERCLCVVAPLQIKVLLTPKRMFVVIVCVYIILMFSGAPVYAVNRLDMIFSPWRNKTILGLVSTPDKEHVEKISFVINSFVLPFAAFAVVIVCTIILVISLRNRTKWRTKSAATLTSEVNSRNLRVAKMVVMISTLFISCFMPISVIVLAGALEPSLSLGGKNLNLGFIVGGVGIFTECINYSSNIFIYYHMSIRYRETFNSIFCKYSLANNLQKLS